MANAADRSLSTYRYPSRTPPAHADPSRYVAGVTREQLESDATLAAFFKANFPDWDSEPDEIDPIAEVKALQHEAATKREVQQGDSGRSKVAMDERLAVPDELAALNIQPFYTYLRDMETEKGTNVSRKMREFDRLIPGVIYGFEGRPKDQIAVKTPWNLLHGQLDRYHHHFESRVYELSVYETPESDEPVQKHTVIPRDMQRHPYLNKLWCINYMRYYPGRTINLPIRYINEEESPAMKRGGFVAPVSRYVPCVVEEGVPIPDFIDLECTGLQLKNVLRMERLVFPDGVKVDAEVDKDNFLVGTVFGRRALIVDDSEGGEEGEGESSE